MNEEDEEFVALEQRLSAVKEVQERRRNCKHRWEESTFGKKHWALGTWQFMCNRCGSVRMIVMEAA